MNSESKKPKSESQPSASEGCMQRVVSQGDFLTDELRYKIERHLHDEASSMEDKAMVKMKDGATHLAYDQLDTSKALRIAANYIGGVACG